MKRSIFVIISFTVGCIIGAQSIWTGNATVGDSSDFPGNSVVARAKSSTFPTGTLLSVNNPKTGKSIEVKVIERLGTPGVLILVEQSAGSAIGLPSDHVFPVRVSPVSLDQTRINMPMAFLDDARSADPDINPLATLGDDSAILSEEIKPETEEAVVLDIEEEVVVEEAKEYVVPETLVLGDTGEPEDELEIEPVVETFDEAAGEDREEDLSDLYIVGVDAEPEPDVKGDEHIIEPEPEVVIEPEPEVVIEPEPEVVIEPEPEVVIEEDLEQPPVESPRNSGFSQELAGELAEVPVNDNAKAIEGEYREFELPEALISDDATEVATPVSPYEDAIEIEEDTRFVYGLEEDKTELDTTQEDRASAESLPIEDVVIEEEPHLVDDKPPIQDDDSLMVFPPMLDDRLAETDENSYLVDDLPMETTVMAPIVDENPPSAEVFTPTEDDDPTMLDDRLAETDAHPYLVDDLPTETTVMAPIVDDNPPSAEVFTPIKDDDPDDDPIVADASGDEFAETDAKEEEAIPEEHGIYFLTAADLMPPEHEDAAIPEDADIEDSIDVGEDKVPENMVLIEDSAITDEESLYSEETSILNEDEFLSTDETVVKKDIDSVEDEIISGPKWIQELSLTPVSLGIGNHYVQIGTYRNVDILKARISELKTTSPWYPLSYEFREDKGVYRLLIGPLRSAEKGVVLRTIRSTLTSDAIHYTP